jgi:RND family efflux transporter MFP subunit
VLTPGSEQGVVKLTDLTKLIAEIDVNEAEVRHLSLGQAADVTPDAAPDKVYPGKVSEIAQEADRARGTVLVKVDVAVPDRSLRPGNSVKATVKPGTGSRVLVPSTAVSSGKVWVVGRDKRVSARPVSVRTAGPDTLEVLSGLKTGETIVAVGIAGLKAGDKVD